MNTIKRAAVVVAALAAGSTALLATPASAVTVDTDFPRIVGTDVDFGSIAVDPGPFATGTFQPAGFGELRWDSVAGDITPHLTGWMYTENLAATCAKMRITYYTESAGGAYVYLTQRGSPEICPNTNAIDLTEIDMAPFTDPAIARVIVSTTVENASGQFVNINSQAFNLGD